MTGESRTATQRYLSVSQAAIYLSVPENTLRSWIAKRQIPCFRAVGRVLLDRELIDEWLGRRAVGVDETP